MINKEVIDYSEFIIKGIDEELYISSFGIDADNELYIVDHTGPIYKIVN